MRRILCERDQNPAFALERFPAVGNKEVVADQQITFSPGKGDPSPHYRASNDVDIRIGDWVAVTIGHVERETGLGQAFCEFQPGARVESRRVPMIHLADPEFFAGHRVWLESLGGQPSDEAAVGEPLELVTIALQDSLDHCRIRGFELRLPTAAEPHSTMEMVDVGNALLPEGVLELSWKIPGKRS